MLCRHALRTALARRGACAGHHCTGGGAPLVPPSRPHASSCGHSRAAQHACSRARRRGVCASAGAAAADSPLVAAVPLSERPAAHEVCGAELAAWLLSARAEVQALGPSGLQLAGGGASVEELLRELQWLCEDAVSSWRAADAADAAERSPGDAWRTLQRSGALDSAGTAATLRASLHELKALWQSRLHDRQPFQYTVAAAHWRDLVLAVGPGVLIPRPETEALIDLAEAALLAQPRLRHATWADAGTGSGALAVALSRLLPLSAPPVVALDVSPVPLAYATANAQRAGQAGRVVTMQGSWLAPLLLQRGRGCLGGLLSNPPYIPNQRLPALQPEVGRHEPHLALDGGGIDGADALRALVSDATQALRAGGFMALETDGGEQADVVAAFVESVRLEGGPQEMAFERVAVEPDCQGVRRFVTAWRTGRYNDE